MQSRIEQGKYNGYPSTDSRADQLPSCRTATIHWQCPESQCHPARWVILHERRWHLKVDVVFVHQTCAMNDGRHVLHHLPCVYAKQRTIQPQLVEWRKYSQTYTVNIYKAFGVFQNNSISSSFIAHRKPNSPLLLKSLKHLRCFPSDSSCRICYIILSAEESVWAHGFWIIHDLE